MINFGKVEQSVRQLKNRVAAGEINQKALETQMMEMVDIAADGYYWMFGYESETWYQHDGQQWIAKDPGKLRLFTPQDDDASNEKESTSQPTSSTSREDNTHSNSRVITQLASSSKQSLKSEWQSLNWGWFVISLLVIGLIAWAVFVSTLV